MTTYAFPTLTLAAPPAMEWGLKSNTQVFTSPLNGSVQTLELPGARWTVSATFTSLAEADAAALQAWALKLRGQGNRFTLHNWERPAPRGTINLSGVTLAADVAQFATTCTLAGCGAAKTLKAGDYIGVAGELKMVVADATADGAGAMSGVTFEPPVRASAGWASAAAVTTDKPTAVFMLSDPHVRWSTRAPVVVDFAIDAVEIFQ